MQYSVYVGPYMIVPRSGEFHPYDWDHLVADGRGESGVGEPVWYLVPNVKIPNCEREMWYGRDERDGVDLIMPKTMHEELRLFWDMLHDGGLFDAVNKTELTAELNWGVVVRCA